ncbi:MAG: glutamate-1-semialdehyde 2,1-aminomutase [Deinococcales bacterium]
MTTRLERSAELKERAHRIIPGGAHTYAKGDDQYPVVAPGFIARGDGCHVWDVDGNRYIEYGSGLRSVTLGHAHPAVVEAAHEQMRLGTNFVRPAVLEVEAADELRHFVGRPDDMVKFAKNGSDVTTAAVRLSRAFTGRSRVAYCADQPFFSVDDWFIGTTAMNAGVPSATRDLSVGFPYGDLAALQRLFERYPGEIACVVTPDGYLEGVQALCRDHGALWVLDEMIAGFRLAHGGASEACAVAPDLLTYGKGTANGLAVSALVGRRDVMLLGGLEHDAERVFLLSYTHGAESASLAVARAVMRIYRDEDVIGDLARAGSLLRDGLLELAAAHGIEQYVHTAGPPGNLVFVTRDANGDRSQSFRALFMQELVRHGVLAPSFVVNRAHDADAIAQTLEAVDRALVVYSRALENGVQSELVGRPVQPVFRRFNGEHPSGGG